jgi:hypothetical protein
MGKCSHSTRFQQARRGIKRQKYQEKRDRRRIVSEEPSTGKTSSPITGHIYDLHIGAVVDNDCGLIKGFGVKKAGKQHNANRNVP